MQENTCFNWIFKIVCQEQTKINASSRLRERLVEWIVGLDDAAAADDDEDDDDEDDDDDDDDDGDDAKSVQRKIAALFRPEIAYSYIFMNHRK